MDWKFFLEMDLQVTGPVQFSVRDRMHFGEEGVVEYKEDNHETGGRKSGLPCKRKNLTFLQEYSKTLTKSLCYIV